MLARSKEKALLKFASFRAMERRASRIRTNHRARKPPSLALPARETARSAAAHFHVQSKLNRLVTKTIPEGVAVDGSKRHAALIIGGHSATCDDRGAQTAGVDQRVDETIKRCPADQQASLQLGKRVRPPLLQGSRDTGDHETPSNALHQSQRNKLTIANLLRWESGNHLPFGKPRRKRKTVGEEHGVSQAMRGGRRRVARIGNLRSGIDQLERRGRRFYFPSRCRIAAIGCLPSIRGPE